VWYIVYKIFKAYMLYRSRLPTSRAKISFVMMRTVFADDGLHCSNLT
jgi:hypothetical protein